MTNEAAKGYLLYALAQVNGGYCSDKKIKVSNELKTAILNGMQFAFDYMTEEEAETYYMSH